MTTDEKVIAAVTRRPGLTEAQLAEVIFGGGGYQQRVNGACRFLSREGYLVRTGKGGQHDPFTYTLGTRLHG
jgi:restriction endonuclease Mrr